MVFLDQLVQDEHLKEYMDEEKTRAKKAKVRPNPTFDRGDDEANKITEEEKDFPLGTINMIWGLNYPVLENRIREEIRLIRQMNEVLSVQSMAKKPRQTVFELGSITFFKVDLEKVQHSHSDLLVIQLRMNGYDVKKDPGGYRKLS